MNDQRITTDQGTARVVETWLHEGADALPGGESIPDHLMRRVIQDVEQMPQQTGRLRWLKRPGMSLRTTNPDRRTRLMFSATGLVAAFAVLALVASVLTTQEARPPAVLKGSEYVVAADGGGDYETIGEAVEAAVDGDTIHVQPGTYAESVVIDKDITVSGVPGDPSAVIVDIPDEGPRVEFPCQTDCPTTGDVDWHVRYAFSLVDADADIGNLTIHGPDGEVGALVVVGGDPLFHDVVVELDDQFLAPHGSIFFGGDAAGTVRDSVFNAMVYIKDAASPRLEGNAIANHIRNDGDSSAQIVGNEIVEVLVHGRARPIVKGNLIDLAFELDGTIGGGCAVSLYGESRPSVVDNIIQHSAFGICLESGEPAAISDNMLIDNQTGISVSTDAAISGNSVVGGSRGIVVTKLSGPTLIGNSVEGASMRGISLDPGTGAFLSGNRACGNAVNLWVGPNATPEMDGTNEICEDALAE